MKKKVFNTSNVRSTRGGINDLGCLLSISKGKISFSQQLAGLLDVDKNRINFIQDEDRPKDWYLEPTQDKCGFLLRSALNKNSGAKRPTRFLQCTDLADRILESIGIKETKGIRFQVATEPEDGMFAIITKSLKIVKRKEAEDA